MITQLKKNSVALFMVQDSSEFNNEILSFYLTYLSETEMRKYNAFHFDKDKRIYLISHAMVRLVLSSYTDLRPADLFFEYNEFGKPFLKNCPEFSFNLSHSQSAAVLAVCNNKQYEIGVDIEYTHRNHEFTDSIQHFFSPAECELFKSKSKSEKKDLFYKLWTIKEAYMKAIGKGLSLGLDSFSFNVSTSINDVIHYCDVENKIKWYFGQMRPYENFQSAVAIRNFEDNKGQFQVSIYDYQPGKIEERKNLEVTSFITN